MSLQWNLIELYKNFWKSTVEKMFTQTGTMQYKVYDQKLDEVIDLEIPTIKQLIIDTAGEGGGGSAAIDDNSISLETTYSSYKIQHLIDHEILAKSYVPYLTSLTGLAYYYVIDYQSFNIDTANVIGNIMKLDPGMQIQTDALDSTLDGTTPGAEIAFNIVLKHPSLKLEYSIDNTTWTEVTNYETKYTLNSANVYLRLTNTSTTDTIWTYAVVFAYN